MSLVAVGVSHHSADLNLLERLGAGDSVALLEAMRAGEFVDEVAVVRTCNRLEAYADVSRFHGGVDDIAAALARVCGVDLQTLTEHMYVHYEGAAVSHAFRVASGLDSMAVGEAQILGQMRAALRLAQEGSWCGHAVGRLMEQALRVGKRAHTETGLDKAAGSLVDAGLSRAEQLLGPLGQARVLVLGAGAMAGLVMGALARAQAGEVAILSRTSARAARLASTVGAQVVPPGQLASAMANANLVIATAGASGYLVSGAEAAQARTASGVGRVFVDLALPRDIDPAVAQVPDTHVVDLEVIGDLLGEQAAHASSSVRADLEAVEKIITEEVTTFVAAQIAASVAPTVVALRERAAEVVAAELSRLESRLGDVDEQVRAELATTVHRVVDKLLHTPTVRVKQLAGERAGDSYADVLRDLFDLDVNPVSVTGMPLRETTLKDTPPGGGARA